MGFLDRQLKKTLKNSLGKAISGAMEQAAKQPEQQPEPAAHKHHQYDELGGKYDNKLYNNS